MTSYLLCDAPRVSGGTDDISRSASRLDTQTGADQRAVQSQPRADATTAGAGSLAQNWLVRFKDATVRGEPAKLHEVPVKADSERGAIRAAFLNSFGGLTRPIHALEMLGVHRAA